MNILITNARIYTVNQAQPWASAIAIANEDPQTANHAERKALALKVMAAPEAYAAIMAIVEPCCTRPRIRIPTSAAGWR